MLTALMRRALILLFIAFILCCTASAAVTVDIGHDCSHSVIRNAATTSTCTITFTSDTPLTTPTFTSKYFRFIDVVSTSECTKVRSSNTLTISSLSSTPVTCTFKYTQPSSSDGSRDPDDTQFSPADDLLYNGAIIGKFQSKSWDPNFIELRPDCKSTSLTCTMILHFPKFEDTPQVTLRGSNFKSAKVGASGDPDFSSSASVSSATLAVSRQEPTQFGAQFIKATSAQVVGCVPVEFSIYISSRLASGTSWYNVPINTAFESCSPLVQLGHGDNCNTPNLPMCTLSLPYNDNFGLNSEVVVGNIFAPQLVSGLERPPYYPFTPTTNSPCTLEVDVNGHSLNIKFTSKQTCTFDLYKPDMREQIDPTDHSLTLVIQRDVSNAVKTTPLLTRRIFTQPLFDAKFQDNCLDPVVPTCTYTFSSWFTRYMHVTHRDVHFFGQDTHSTESTSGIIVDCGESYVTALVDGDEIDYAPSSSAPTGQFKVTCSITVNLPVRYVVPLDSTPELYFLVSDESSILTIQNSPVATIPAYPPKVFFDPIDSIVTSPACNDPAIHICTISFTHPAPLSVPITIGLKGIFIGPAIATSPIPDSSVVIKQINSVVGVSAWTLLGSASLPFSTITFPKGPIGPSFDFKLNYYEINGHATSSLLNDASNPVLDDTPTVSIAHLDFLKPLADCLDENTALCTVSYQSFTTKFSITVPHNVKLLNIHPGTLPTPDESSPDVRTYTVNSGLNQAGMIVTLTFSTPFLSTSFDANVIVTASELSPSTTYSYDQPQSITVEYDSEAVFSGQGDCTDLTVPKCTLLTSFSNLDVQDNGILLEFELPLGVKLDEVAAAEPQGNCDRITIASSTTASNTIITVKKAVSATTDTYTALLCPIVLYKAYTTAVTSSRVTTLYTAPSQQVRRLNMLFNPISFAAGDSCTTYPKTGDDFKCHLTFGFMGGIINTFTSTPITDYKWFAPQGQDVECLGAAGFPLAKFRYEATGTTGTYSLVHIDEIKNALDMLTFCRISYSVPATGYNLEELSLTFDLNKDTTMENAITTQFDLTFPAPPTQKPITFDLENNNSVTITFVMEGIESFTLLDDNFELTDASCGTLLSYYADTRTFTVNTPGYTAGESCNWAFVPTARTPTDGEHKHSIKFVDNDTLYFAYFAYPLLNPPFKFEALTPDCIDVEFCTYQVTLTPKTGPILDIFIDNNWNWRSSGQAVPCLAEDGNVIATLSAPSSQKLHFNPVNGSVVNPVTCKITIPVATYTRRQWVPIEVHSENTSSTDLSIYEIRLVEQSPINYIDLLPAFCRLGEKCTYKFTINPEYAKTRPLFSFESPFTGYWEAQDGNFCALSQLGKTVYLRVINDEGNFAPFGLTAQCSIALTPTSLADISQFDAYGVPTGDTTLQINRYHLPADVIVAAQTNQALLFETDRFAPPDLARYTQQLTIPVNKVHLYPPNYQAITVQQPFGTSCIANESGLCSLEFTARAPGIKTLRVTNFMSFDSVVDTGVCKSNNPAHASIHFTPGHGLQYIYAQYLDLEGKPSTFPPGYSCKMDRQLIETRSSTAHEHAYEFDMIGNTGDIETTLYIGVHQAQYPAYSPFGFYINNNVGVSDELRNSYLVQGAENSWIRFLARRPGNEINARVVKYKSLLIKFDVAKDLTSGQELDPVPINNVPTIDTTMFEQIACHIIPRHRTGILPSCAASSSANGDPTSLSVTFSDNTSSESVNGFYLSFRSQRLPATVSMIYQSVDTYDNARTALAQTLPFVDIRLGATPRLAPPVPFKIDVWPAEYNRGEDMIELADEERVFYFHSEVDTNFVGVDGSQAQGTPVRVQINAPIPTGAYIEVQLFVFDNLSLPRQLTLQLIKLDNHSGTVQTIEAGCDLCLAFVPTNPSPDNATPVFVEFTMTLRYLARLTSFRERRSDSTVFLRVNIHVPAVKEELPFAIAPVQEAINNPGNTGGLGGVDASVETALITTASWTSGVGHVIAIHSQTSPLISNPSSIASIVYPTAMFTNTGESTTAKYNLTLNPSPDLSQIFRTDATQAEFNAASDVEQRFFLNCNANQHSDHRHPTDPLNYGLGLTLDWLKQQPELTLETNSGARYAYLDTPTLHVPIRQCTVHGITKITRHSITYGVSVNSQPKEYIFSTTFEHIPFLPPQTLSSFLGSTVCHTLDVPVFYAAGAAVSAQQASNLGTWTTFTINVPKVYTLDPVTTQHYTLRSQFSTSTTTNSYVLTVAPGNVHAIHTRWNCPASDVIDASAQSIQWRVGNNPAASYLNVERGYYIYKPLSELNSVYIMNIPENGVRSDAEPIVINAEYKASVSKNHDLNFYTPPNSHHHLWKISAPLFNDGNGVNIFMELNANDQTRVSIFIDRDVYIFDKTRWDGTGEPIPAAFPIIAHSQYYDSILTQLCHNDRCSTPGVSPIKVIPEFNMEYTLRFEVGTEIPSTIILNREMVIQNKIVLTWDVSYFDVKAHLITGENFSYEVVRGEKDGQDVYVATISFHRYWPANTPINFPFEYQLSPSKTMRPEIFFSIYFDDEPFVLRYNNGTPITQVAMRSTQYGSLLDTPPSTPPQVLPTEPVYDFAIQPDFRSETMIQFSFKMGRPLLFGQQLVFSPMPLAPNWSFTTREEYLARTTTIQVLQVYEMVVQTSAAANYPGCEQCVILSIATTSQLTIPPGQIRFSVNAGRLIVGQVVSFTDISVSSNGFGIDALELTPFSVATRPPSNPFVLMQRVLLQVSPTKYQITNTNPPVYREPICKINNLCDLTVKFEGELTGASDALLAKISFIGYELDVQSMPTAQLTIQGATPTITLYSFSKNETIFLIRGTSLDRMEFFTMTALFTQGNLDGYVSLVLRSLEGYSDPQVPDFYHSTNVLGPKVYSDQIDTKFFHINGGSFVGESIGFGFIPTIPYSESTTTPHAPASMRFVYRQYLGGLYTYPILAQASETPNLPVIYPVDPTAITLPTPVGKLSFTESSNAEIGDDPELWNINLILQPISYFASNEPLITRIDQLQWSGEFQPNGLIASAYNSLNTVAIDGQSIPFFRVRPLRAVRVVPQLSMLNVNTPVTFNLTIYEDFLDSVHFLPDDTITLRIPTLYTIDSTTTYCNVNNSLTGTPVNGFHGELINLNQQEVDPNDNITYNLLRFVVVSDGDISLLKPNSATTRDIDPEYHCPITVTVSASGEELLQTLTSESPLSSLSFTAASLGTSSTFDFFMPYPHQLPTYEMSLVGFDTIDVPGYVWFKITRAYFGPYFVIQFKLPFQMAATSTDSVFCRSPDHESPLMLSTHLSATQEFQIQTLSFVAMRTLECRFSMVPKSAYTHAAVETWQAQLTAGTQVSTIPLTVRWFETQSSLTELDITTARPSYAISAPIPSITIEGDIVSGLESKITLTGQQMTLRAGDIISFSMGVQFTNTERTADVTGLQCLTNSLEPFADVKFQFVGDFVAGSAPTPNALPEGQLGIANRIQLIPLASTPPSTPWRCTIQIRPAADYEGRLPDASVLGAAYPVQTVVRVSNELVFRSAFTLDLGLARALEPGAKLGTFEFYYNSTDVQLIQNSPSPSIQVQLPLQFATTPVDGVTCQLNHGVTMQLPIFITATSSVATNFLVPTERLIVPTSSAINYVRCTIPNLNARPTFASEQTRFTFKQGLIDKSEVALPAVSGFTLAYQTPNKDRTIDQTAWTQVQLSSSDAIPVVPSQQVIMRWSLTNWGFVTPIYPTFPTDAQGKSIGISFGRGCTRFDTWHKIPELGGPYVFYFSEQTQSWVTLESPEETYCDITLDVAPETPPGVYTIPMLIGNSPNHSSVSLNVEVKQAPHCVMMDTVVFDANGTGEWALSVEEVERLRAIKPRDDLVDFEMRGAPFARTDTISNVRMACRGFDSPAAIFGIDFVENPESHKRLNELATTYSQFLFHDDITLAAPNHSPSYIAQNCRGLDLCTGPTVPVEIKPEGFILDWVVQLDTFVAGLDIDAFNVTTPYEVKFRVHTNPLDFSQFDEFSYFIDLNLIPRSTLPSSPLAVIQPLSPTVPPRGKAASFLLTVRDLPRGETWVVPMWNVEDPEVDPNDPTTHKTIFDYFMSPLKVFDAVLGSAVACYDPNSSTSVLAFVTLQLEYTTGLDPMLVFAIQPQPVAISASEVGSTGISYQCVFPLMPIAPPAVKFLDIPDATLELVNLLLSQFLFTRRFLQDTAALLAPQFTRPSFNTLFTNDFAGLSTSFFGTLNGSISSTSETGFLAISIDGDKVYPGDVVVIRFQPLSEQQGEGDANPNSSYRFYAPPVGTAATPCYNQFYPTGLEEVGTLTALTPDLHRLVGQSSNTIVLDITASRAGDYQQLLCLAPFTTFLPMDTHGAIYGRVYRSHEFKLLQQSSTFTRFDFTTELRTEHSTSLLYYLPPIGYIGEPIKRDLYLAARSLAPVPSKPAQEITIRFTISSSPPRSAATVVADLREYRPHALIGCNNSGVAKNIRYYGQGDISDDTRNLLRFDLDVITEADIVVDCKFVSPDATPQNYYIKETIETDDGFVYTVPYFLTSAYEINNRPDTTIPIRLYNIDDVTTGGMPTNDNVRPISDAALYLQSPYSAPNKGARIDLYFQRARTSPYIDGSERTTMLNSLARNFGKRVSTQIEHALYTLFKGSDLLVVDQYLLDGEDNFLANSTPEAARANVTLALSVVFTTADASNIVAPYAAAGVFDVIKGFGADQEHTTRGVNHVYDSVWFPECTSQCGGNCEPCPVGDHCTSDADCRAGLSCLTVIGIESGVQNMIDEGHCASSQQYEAAKLISGTTQYENGFKVTTSNTLTAQQLAKQESDSQDNSAFTNNNFAAVIGIIICLIALF